MQAPCNSVSVGGHNLSATPTITNFLCIHIRCFTAYFCSKTHLVIEGGFLKIMKQRVYKSYLSFGGLGLNLGWIRLQKNNGV